MDCRRTGAKGDSPRTMVGVARRGQRAYTAKAWVFRSIGGRRERGSLWSPDQAIENDIVILCFKVRRTHQSLPLQEECPLRKDCRPSEPIDVRILDCPRVVQFGRYREYLGEKFDRDV